MEIHIRLTIDDRLVALGRRVRRGLSRPSALLLLALAGVSATVGVMAAPASKPHDFEAGGAIKAAEINANFDTLYAELEARVIRSDQKIEVADCVGLVAALETLEDRRITSSAKVTIELAAATSACKTAVTVDHPDGSHIQIVGKGNGMTALTFFSTHGFVVPMSRSLGLLDKLTMTSTGGTGSGVVVRGAASVALGSDLVVRQFDDGVYTEGGFIVAEGVISEDNSEMGFRAVSGGFIRATSALARRNGMHGFNAFLGASIYADKATSEMNGLYGFNANVGSAIHAAEAKATSNKHGFDANANGTIIVNAATATDHEFGFAAWNSSHIEGDAPVANDAMFAGYSARLGSYVHVTTPGGDSLTYAPPAANVWNDAEGNMVQQD